MTIGEHKFALAVERVCTMVSTPEYRQLIIEAIHVLGSLMMYDIDNSLYLDCIVKVEDIIEKANHLFLIDQVSVKRFSVIVAFSLHCIIKCWIPVISFGIKETTE
ncbi:unnamed protein product [Trichobilharzia regenti]|nr:unnamed protein product [Trichobilharzia regenti]